MTAGQSLSSSRERAEQQARPECDICLRPLANVLASGETYCDLAVLYTPVIRAGEFPDVEMPGHSIQKAPVRKTTLLLFAFIFLAIFLPTLPAFSQATFTPPTTQSQAVSLDGAWKFTGQTDSIRPAQSAFDDTQWATVTVPHTWESRTDLATHRAAWYRRHFTLTGTDRGHEIYLQFAGAATVADVYLNGVFLGEHRGAYTRFLFDATAAANFQGDNVLAVRVDNNPLDTSDCLPSGIGIQLYHVYGGLYRHVSLLKTAKVHVDPTDDAASGLFITPENVGDDGADAVLRTLVRNDSLKTQTVTVQDTLTDPAGRVTTTMEGTATVSPQSRSTVVLIVHVPHPQLWGPGHPALYSVTTQTLMNGMPTDYVTEHTGFRYFQMTPYLFTLNGQTLPLRGVAKHQETEESATAVSETDLVHDWDQLQDLGVNFVRLAHYPHAALEYDEADRRGIIVWAENGHSNAGPPTQTGEQITREMVRQNYNHPSILFWSAGNEAIQQMSDVQTIEDYATVIAQEDSTRYITYASDTRFDADPTLSFVAANRYNGWYGGAIWSFDAQIKAYHWFSETGAGGVISTHTDALAPTHIVNKFEPEEYQDLVAEARCQEVFRNLSDQVPLLTWWTFRDFNDPRYKGYNTKGLETAAGFPKDDYYIFQTFLRPQTPLVHLCGKTWFLRRGTDGTGIKAYSNAAQLTLTLNGQVIGKHLNGEYRQFGTHPVENVFYWDAPPRPGKYQVTVDDGLGHSDSALLDFEGAHGQVGKSDPKEWIQDLKSSNRANPARYIDEPIQAEWPFYDDYDGTGDNTFHVLPEIVTGAQWITTGRMSKPQNKSALSFRIAPDTGPMDVFVMLTPGQVLPKFVLDAGFTDTGITGTWRDNQMTLVPYALYRKTVLPGGRVHLDGDTRDYVVLVKPGERSLTFKAPAPVKKYVDKYIVPRI
jgi:beta-galactosidase